MKFQDSIKKKSLNNLDIHFGVESADRSVGIMSEGFSAWVINDNCWVNLEDIVKHEFAWYDADTGNMLVEKPKYAHLVEQCLIAYANAWYEMKKD